MFLQGRKTKEGKESEGRVKIFTISTIERLSRKLGSGESQHGNPLGTMKLRGGISKWI